MGTKTNPSKYDCYAKLEPDEPYFVLMGRDPVAWATVLMWCAFRDLIFSDDKEKIEEAKRCSRAMFEYAVDQCGKERFVVAFNHALAKVPRVHEMVRKFML